MTQYKHVLGDAMTGTDIALRSSLDYATALAESNLLPAQYRGRPANILYALEFGRTIGLTPMAAITGVHVIDGRPTASAGLISALVRAAGHRLRLSGDATRAVCEIIRSDDPGHVFRAEWDLEKAKVAGLTGKDVWRKYPTAMLKARAITECARDACEEVLFGLHYTPEELGAEVDGEGEIIEQSPAPAVVSAPAISANAWAPPERPEPPEDVQKQAQTMAREAAQGTDPTLIRRAYAGAGRGARDVDISGVITADERAVVVAYEPKVGTNGPLALKWWMFGCAVAAEQLGLSVEDAAEMQAGLSEREDSGVIPADDPELIPATLGLDLDIARDEPA